MRVAVFGATGLVGREMMRVLEERNFPVDELVPLASPRSEGKSVLFRGEAVEVHGVSGKAFEGVDLALFSAGGGPSREWAPVAAEAGAVVVDNSSAWRMAEEVPLVVPEINPEDLEKHRGIVANPNCSTIQTVVALAPLHRKAVLRSLVAVTFQSVAGTGSAALRELEESSRSVLDNSSWTPRIYPHPIGFNVLPHIGDFDDQGITQEEWKMMRESRKILHLPDLRVSCTATRVPVFRGHGVAVTAAFEKPLSPQEARNLLEAAPGVLVTDNPGENLYPLQGRVGGTDPVQVGRIRREPDFPNTLSFWVVGDNLRKGAALNAVQIGEALLERGLL
jgi:aspartate-semialdehyde dehydrogenase